MSDTEAYSDGKDQSNTDENANGKHVIPYEQFKAEIKDEQVSDTEESSGENDQINIIIEGLESEDNEGESQVEENDRNSQEKDNRISGEENEGNSQEEDEVEGQEVSENEIDRQKDEESNGEDRKSQESDDEKQKENGEQ